MARRKRRRRKKSSGKGHVPLGILEKRLFHLNQVVKNRGGVHYTKYRT